MIDDVLPCSFDWVYTDDNYYRDLDIDSFEYLDLERRYDIYERVIPILYNPPLPSFKGDGSVCHMKMN